MFHQMTASLLFAVLFFAWLDRSPAGEEAARITSATTDADGFLLHNVESPYQSGATQIRVLLPEKLEKDQQYPIVYVLPVEADRESRYGDGLLEIKKRNLHNTQGVIFVAPTFSHLPWYADHPDNMQIRQETYFLDVVVPFIEKQYPAIAKPEGRLLLGFSKSGWGAWTLLLRHPETFGRAAAWDAPLMMTTLGKYGTGPIFLSQENFEKYRVDHLLKSSKLGEKPRLILTGYGGFRSHHQQTRDLLNESKIPHEYRDGPLRKHDWHSGWVEETVKLLTKTD